LRSGDADAAPKIYDIPVILRIYDIPVILRSKDQPLLKRMTMSNENNYPEFKKSSQLKV
jgi:hypothetical protein